MINRIEHKQLLSIKNILLNTFNEHSQPHERYVWLIIHLERNMLDQANNDVLFNNWSIDMIDNLNTERFISKDLILNPSYLLLITNKEFLMTDCLFDEMIERCLSKIHYTIINQQDEYKINERRNTIMNSLINPICEGSNLRKILHFNRKYPTN